MVKNKSSKHFKLSKKNKTKKNKTKKNMRGGATMPRGPKSIKFVIPDAFNPKKPLPSKKPYIPPRAIVNPGMLRYFESKALPERPALKMSDLQKYGSSSL
jgi:hypothetical protein